MFYKQSRSSKGLGDVISSLPLSSAIAQNMDIKVPRQTSDNRLTPPRMPRQWCGDKDKPMIQLAELLASNYVTATHHHKGRVEKYTNKNQGSQTDAPRKPNRIPSVRNITFEKI